MSVTQTKDADFVADHSSSSHDVMLTDPWQSFDNNTEQMYLKKIFMRYYCSFILLLFFKFFNYSGWTSIFYLQLLQSRVPQLLNAPKHSQLTMPSKDLPLFIPKQAETGHSAYVVEQCTPASKASASVLPAAPVVDPIWFLQDEQRMRTTTQQLLQRVAAIEPLVPVDHHMDQHHYLIYSSDEATIASTSRVGSTTQLSQRP